MNVEDRERAEAYARERGCVIQEFLGDGLHGSVWKVASQDGTFTWVVKLVRFQPAWHREVLCYRRLRELGTSNVMGVSIPGLLHAEESWRSIEMTTVSAPFLLDFGGAWLDERPEFVPGAWEEAEAKAAEAAEAAEAFGEDWPQARAIIKALEAETGVIMGDVHPGNLRLR